jgi:hypothetical protein
VDIKKPVTEILAPLISFEEEPVTILSVVENVCVSIYSVFSFHRNKKSCLNCLQKH